MIAAMLACVTWGFTTLLCAAAASETDEHKWRVLTYVSLWVCVGFGMIGLILWATAP